MSRKYYVRVYDNPDYDTRWATLLDDDDPDELERYNETACDLVDKKTDEVIAHGVGDNRQEAIDNAKQDLEESTSYEEEEEETEPVYERVPLSDGEKFIAGVGISFAVIAGIVEILFPRKD